LCEWASDTLELHFLPRQLNERKGKSQRVCLSLDTEGGWGGGEGNDKFLEDLFQETEIVSSVKKILNHPL